jgi:molybdopterin-biosynthesis enzyme MoeA-like protein
VAREQGGRRPDQPDNRHRLNMGVLPEGRRLIPNPYNRSRLQRSGDVHFVPGFPVMAHPMIEGAGERVRPG